MRKTLLSSLGLLALTSQVFAADLPSQKSAPYYAEPLGINWTGFYVGGQIGGLWAAGNYTVPSAALSFGENGSSFFGGVHAGYNYQNAAWVFGLQGEINYLNARGTEFVSIYPYSVQQNWLGSIDGRVGYAYKNALFYAIGGVAFTDSTDRALALGTVYSFNGPSVGYDIGGGIEYALNNHWSARVEYRYYDFGRQNNLAVGLVLPAHSYTLNDNTVRVGLSYRFGAEPTVAVLAKY
jgi:outer membrane immunogenic protein